MPATGHPSGLDVADLLLRAGSAAAIVWFGAAARRWTWFVLAGAAAVLSTGVIALALSAGCLALAYFAAFAPRRMRLVGAAISLVSVELLLRLPHRLPAFATALAVAVACVPCLWSGYRVHDRRARKRIRLAVEGACVLAGAFALVFALAVIQGRDTLERGVTEARAALNAARSGDQREALRRFDIAISTFRQGRHLVDAWWARPARALPVVGTQAESLSEAVDSGAGLVRDARETAKIADYSRLRSAGGQIDLRRMESYRQPVAALTRKLDVSYKRLSRMTSPWLLGPLRHRVETFANEVAAASRDARLASEVLDVAPGLLGANGPRRYALLFATPAETRELGGFMGNFGELTAVDGKLRLARTGRSSSLTPLSPEEAARRTLPAPEQLPVRYRYYDPTRFIGNVTGTQDFPTVARTFDAVYRQAGGTAVDGAIYVDPYALAALLKLTGPVAVQGLDVPLTSANAADFLLRQQYATFPNPNRIDFLENASRATFEQLTSRRLPGPRAAADALSPMVHRHRLLAFSFHPEDASLIERLGLSGAVPALEGGDYLSVSNANANPNKIDAYLQRSITDHVSYDPGTGAIRSTVTVALHNTAPASGADNSALTNETGLPLGTNRTFLSVYSPLALSTARVDGRTAGMEAEVEQDRNRYGTFVDVPQGGTTTVEVELEGTLASRSAYRLTYLAQPTANPDRWRVRLAAPGRPGARAPTLAGPTVSPPLMARDRRGSTAEALISGGVLDLRVPLGSGGDR